MYGIRTPQAPAPIGAYSQGASAARFVFVSAQLPLDPRTGEPIDATVGAQAALCLRYVEAILADVDLTLADACELTVYLIDLDDLAIVDEVMAERIPRPWPARTVVGAASLPLGVSVQISAIACR